ncbi:MULTISPECIES: aminotransferase class III-fold pyridoxal phosphate-dependent enzyme [Streptomyces]|uniref:Diaminobutyrate--2-oxoglutarate transaminase n=2 Tax=Streptomyces TaxID=1883 RepID=A0A117IVM3_9ACTN|nr:MULTISPECIES: aminotransferase class III-fold pyridoxal phosphate-dependent enzyme [Streptomyces]KUH37443.1 2,4-diaminobutyrate 4-aminotransferase [Streptomyces kanasensis]UUS33297.1 aminotransferase class III-fold pyridoxal phosphate-dependent enzyme [Streptomyces changanensis]
MAATEPAPAGPTAGHEGIMRRQALREPAARTYARSLPVVPVRARGVTIEGADGRRYLDCTSGAGILVLGHNHPVVLEAIKRVIDSGAPLDVHGLATPVRDAFTTELFTTLPAALAADARVRFCGPAPGDAVAAALALARTATGRSRVLACAGYGPHAPAAPGRPAGPGPDGDVPVTWLPYPRDGRHPPDGDGGAPHGPRGAEGGIATPAAVIVEPVRGARDVVPAPDDWLRRVRGLTAESSVPLIADERLTGLGRTGSFWAVGHSGVVPDVMVMPEALGASLPLSVIVYRAGLDHGRRDRPAGAPRGNQLAMAAGTATLAYVRGNRLAERAATLGARLLADLRGLAAAHPCVAGVRGRGLMIGVELAAPSPTGDTPPRATTPFLRTAADRAEAVRRECLDRGLIVTTGGRASGVVRLLPPLTLTDGQAAAVLDRFADAVAATERTQPH